MGRSFKHPDSVMNIMTDNLNVLDILMKDKVISDENVFGRLKNIRSDDTLMKDKLISNVNAFGNLKKYKER